MSIYASSNTGYFTDLVVLKPRGREVHQISHVFDFQMIGIGPAIQFVLHFHLSQSGWPAGLISGVALPWSDDCIKKGGQCQGASEVEMSISLDIGVAGENPASKL